MSKPFLARQGDVLILAVPGLPDAAQPVERDRGRVVLAYGEATGHAHALLDRHATLHALPDETVEDRWLTIVDELATVVHEEHDPISLAPGTYLVRRQRTYTAADQPTLRVAD